MNSCIVGFDINLLNLPIRNHEGISSTPSVAKNGSTIEREV